MRTTLLISFLIYLMGLIALGGALSLRMIEKRAR